MVKEWNAFLDTPKHATRDWVCNRHDYGKTARLNWVRLCFYFGFVLCSNGFNLVGCIQFGFTSGLCRSGRHSSHMNVWSRWDKICSGLGSNSSQIRVNFGSRV